MRLPRSTPPAEPLPAEAPCSAVRRPPTPTDPGQGLQGMMVTPGEGTP